MNQYLCINCWRISEPGDLLYRCPECASPSPSSTAYEPWLMNPNQQASADSGSLYRPIHRGRMSTLARWFGEAEDAEVDGPVCGEHPRARVQLFCPCRAPLVPRSYFSRNSPLTLGIAGPRNAGKTLLLLGLVHQLQRKGLGDRHLGLLGLGDTETRFGALGQALFRNGHKPGATPQTIPQELFDPKASIDPQTVPQSFCWQLIDSRERRKPARLLAVYDLAGETWGLDSTRGEPSFDRYLRLLSSLIFVVDGAEVAGDLGLATRDAWDRASGKRKDDGAMDRQWLSRIIDRMGDRSQTVDLALVVTKADLLWNTSEWSDLDPDSAATNKKETSEARLEELLDRAHRRDLVLAARRHFARTRLFAISSLGFLPGSKDVVEKQLDRRPEPKGILEPFEWLLSHRPEQRKR